MQQMTVPKSVASVHIQQGSYREVRVKFKDFSRTSKDYLTVIKD